MAGCSGGGDTLTAAWTTAFGDDPNTPDPNGRPGVTHLADLDEHITMAADYLAGACGPDGTFRYRVNRDPGVIIKRRYNMLRHAGAIYALACYAQHHNPKPAATAAVRAAGFLRRSIAPLPNVPGVSDDRDPNVPMLAVWSSEAINGSGDHLQAKLGGAGLGLAALVRLERVVPGTTDMTTLRALGNFLLYMQKPDGSFYSKYFPVTTGRDDAFDSLYYPGEAILGLVLLYEQDNDNPRWARAAAKGLQYLAHSRRDAAFIPQDHWALIATAELLRVAPRDMDIDRPALISHAAQVAGSMLLEAATVPLSAMKTSDPGCFTHDGRTCPTATRLEGLLAVRGVLDNRFDLLVAQLDRQVTRSMTFLVNSQVTDGGVSRRDPSCGETVETRRAVLQCRFQ